MTNKFRPLLGAAVDGPKRFVPFVLEASEAFLEYLQQSICSFPILHLRALVCVLSANKHNARMVLRWVRFLSTLFSVAGLIAFKTFAHASIT